MHKSRANNVLEEDEGRRKGAGTEWNGGAELKWTATNTNEKRKNCKVGRDAAAATAAAAHRISLLCSISVRNTHNRHCKLYGALATCNSENVFGHFLSFPFLSVFTSFSAAAAAARAASTSATVCSSFIQPHDGPSAKRMHTHIESEWVDERRGGEKQQPATVLNTTTSKANNEKK